MNTVFISLSKFAKEWFDKLWKFFLGGVVAIVGFSSNFIDIKQPAVGVEITEIEQKTSATTDISSSPDYKALRTINDQLHDDSPKKIDLNADEMQRLVDRVRSKLGDEKTDFLKQREQILTILQKRDQKSDKTPNATSPETGFIFGLPLGIVGEEVLTTLPTPRLQREIALRENSFREKEELIRLAEIEVKNYRERTEKLEAQIKVTIAVTNSGDGATTLKPQALLRTDLGQGNYLDINLKIEGYGAGSAEIKPRSTVILKLESQPIRKMAPDDRDRFLSFFKNTSPTNLFVADVRGAYYISNTIPFAQGIYEQKIYDGLKVFASKNRM